MTDVAELLLTSDRGNPYPTYDTVRAGGLQQSTFGPWVTAEHATCVAVLRDHRFGGDASALPDYEPPEPNYFADGRATPTESLLSMDPPEHTRVRRLVSHAFTPRALASLRDFVQDTTAGLIADMRGAGTVDLIDVFAFPIPLAVICRILGVPVEDRARFRKWGDDLVPMLDPIQSDESRAIARKADAELTAYLDTLIDDRRSDLGDDLLSELIVAEEAGDKLSSDELLSAASLILGAGFETTVNLIGNGLLALLRHPEALARLRSSPELMPTAIDELLRFDSPVQMTGRIVLEPVSIGGTDLPRGANVMLLLGGANRDPQVFDEPNSLDVSRANASEHLSFSSGTHHCLGASLARLEGQVALGALIDAFSKIELVVEPRWRETMVLHGLESLHLALA